MRVLVSGAAGFIGRHLVAHLSAEHEVVALVRPQHKTPPLPGLGEGVGGWGPRGMGNVTPTPIDLTRPLEGAALPGSVDVVIHLAQANVRFPDAADELFAVNTAATQQLLDYARRAGAERFILASSGDVYGFRRGPCRESDQPTPTSFYGVTKYASELLVGAYAGYVQGCVMRLFQPFGPGQVSRLIPRLAERIQQGEAVRLHGDDRPHVTPIYVGDVVVAIERAIRLPSSEVLNVAGDTVVSMRELAEAIGRVLERAPIFEPSGESAGDMMGDNARMKAVLGAWPMVGLSDGLASTFERQEDIWCPAGV